MVEFDSAEVATVETVSNPYVFVEAESEKLAKQEALGIYDPDEYFGATALPWAREIEDEAAENLYVVLVMQNAPHAPDEWHTRIQKAEADTEASAEGSGE